MLIALTCLVPSPPLCDTAAQLVRRRDTFSRAQPLVCAASGSDASLRAVRAIPAATLPKHLAVIMDGNARWARGKRLNAAAGHAAGVDALRKLVRDVIEVEAIQTLTVYAFSAENWGRPFSEIEALLTLIRSTLEAEADELSRRGVRLSFIGERHRLPSRLRELVTDLDGAAPVGEERLNLCIALSYGSRQATAEAARDLALRVRQGTLEPDAIDAELLSATIRAKHGPCSDPDLLLRTGGQQRLSNFLLFEAAYAELQVVDTLWPQFETSDLLAVLEEYASRQRTFGVR